MMISSPAASDPYAATTALDRSLHSSNSDPADPSSSSVTLNSGPDVVVTLSDGLQSPSTYDASGKLATTTTPVDNGNSADTLDPSIQATESGGGAATDVANVAPANSDATAATA